MSCARDRVLLALALLRGPGPDTAPAQEQQQNRLSTANTIPCSRDIKDTTLENVIVKEQSSASLYALYYCVDV